MCLRRPRDPWHRFSVPHGSGESRFPPSRGIRSSLRAGFSSKVLLLVTLPFTVRHVFSMFRLRSHPVATRREIRGLTAAVVRAARRFMLRGQSAMEGIEP